MKKNLLFLLFVLLNVTSCSSFSNWFGNEEKPKLKGERIAIIQSKEMLTPENPRDKASLPLPETFNAWPQSDFPHASLQGKQGAFFALNALQEDEKHALNGGFFRNNLSPSSIVIADDRFYTIDKKGLLTSRLLSKPSKILWSLKIKNQGKRSFNGALLFDNSILYVTTGYDAILAVDTLKGTLLWEKKLPHNFHSLPTANSELLYITTLDNHTYALEKTTGNTRWTHGGTPHVTTQSSKISPCLVKDVLIVPYASGELFALEAASGKELWVDAVVSSRPRWWLEYNFNSIIAPPLSDNVHVFTLNSDGLLVAHAVETGTRVWEREIPGISSPWLAGNRLFMVTEDNFLLSLSTKDGKIDWLHALPPSKRIKKKGEKALFWKGPLLAENRLWLFSPDNELWSFSAKNGKAEGHLSYPLLQSTFPMLVKDKMIIFTDKIITLGQKTTGL